MDCGVVPVRVRSSTKSKCVSFASCSLQPYPFSRHFGRRGASALSRVPMKRMPDSGAPCLDPLASGIGLSVVQLYRWGWM